jgi:hypothetical protein
VPDYELNRFCPDQDCEGVAEPEEDLADGGVLRFFKCRMCETEFGYELIRDEAAAGNCSLGIPEPVRRAISINDLTPAETKRVLGPLSTDGPPSAVFLGNIGRRPELWDWTLLTARAASGRSLGSSTPRRSCTPCAAGALSRQPCCSMARRAAARLRAPVLSRLP